MFKSLAYLGIKRRRGWCPGAWFDLRRRAGNAANRSVNDRRPTPHCVFPNNFLSLSLSLSISPFLPFSFSSLHFSLAPPFLRIFFIFASAIETGDGTKHQRLAEPLRWPSWCPGFPGILSGFFPRFISFHVSLHQLIPSSFSETKTIKPHNNNNNKMSIKTNRGMRFHTDGIDAFILHGFFQDSLNLFFCFFIFFASSLLFLFLVFNLISYYNSCYRREGYIHIYICVCVCVCIFLLLLLLLFIFCFGDSWGWFSSFSSRISLEAHSVRIWRCGEEDAAMSMHNDDKKW